MTMTTVSSATDPELAARLAAEATASTSTTKERPEPAIETPPDTTVQLPCGYLTQDEELLRVAVVTELNGADEEAMAKTSSPAAFLNTVLIRGVQTVGGQPATPALLEKLLAADRDALLVAVRRVTYGDHLEFILVCPECKYEHDSKLSVADDIPMKVMDDPRDRWLKVQTSKGEALLTLPNGKTQHEILSSEGKTVAELNTLLLQACVLQIGDMPVTSVLDVRERMSARDRKVLLEALASAQYGPRLEEVSRPCPSCGFAIPIRMTLVDLFRS